MSKPELCHDGVPRSCCASCLDVCAKYFPSITSKHHNKFPFTMCLGGTNSLRLQCHENTNLTVLQTCHAFFGCGEVGVFHWDDCCFVAGSCPNTQVSSPVKMVEIKLGLFSLVFQLGADSNAVFLWSLLSSLGTNFAAMCRMLSASDKIRWHVPYESPTMLQTLWIVCRSSR